MGWFHEEAGVEAAVGSAKDTAEVATMEPRRVEATNGVFADGLGEGFLSSSVLLVGERVRFVRDGIHG